MENVNQPLISPETGQPLRLPASLYHAALLGNRQVVTQGIKDICPDWDWGQCFAAADTLIAQRAQETRLL